MSTDPMAEIKASFFVECDELLESLQDALSDLEEGAKDGETINVAFRAVHSIKGGAGAFGLDALVHFAHRFETVMDELRAGRLSLSPEALKLFFHAADMLSDEVHAARDGQNEPQGADACLADLEGLLGDTPESGCEVETDFQPVGLTLEFETEAEENSDPAAFTIRFTPATNLYASGNDPLHLLRALQGLGDCHVCAQMETLPDLAALAPEDASMGWTITLTGDVTEEDIREVFDFVEDVCELEISCVSTEPLPTPDSGATTQDMLPTPDDVPCTPDPAVPETAKPAAQTKELSKAASNAPSNAPPPAAAPEPGATVRVDLERIDRLVNLVGELVINQAMLAQSVTEAGLPPNSPVMTGLEAFMMLTRDIQDSVMMIRAQPVKPLFQRMGRIVREASGTVGKNVRLRTEGETTEVDKTVIERLADPLTHMIRNAVDHGLEIPEERVAAGKPPEGVITLSAQHRSGRVIIGLTDDGAGIDRTKVRDKAIENGLLPADAQLSDTEIDNLLFLPGFSTADQVSALSGRGVGMDVVKSAIQALGGRISIHSEPGQGTRFSISLPLTLAVLDGMVVQVADETLVVPLSAIVETATLMAEDIRALGPETNVIHLRDAFVPLYDLGAELGYRAPKPSYEGDVVLLTTQENGDRSAIVVDTIMEQRQVVIKGLQRSYGHIPGVAAATILGDGQIALILDPADLVQNATGRTRSADIALAG